MSKTNCNHPMHARLPTETSGVWTCELCGAVGRVRRGERTEPPQACAGPRPFPGGVEYLTTMRRIPIELTEPSESILLGEHLDQVAMHGWRLDQVETLSATETHALLLLVFWRPRR